jgi:hypothetical protein
MCGVLKTISKNSLKTTTEQVYVGLCYFYPLNTAAGRFYPGFTDKLSLGIRQPLQLAADCYSE